MIEQPCPPCPENIALVREASYLCDAFQQHKLNQEDKQKVLTSIIQDYKKWRKIING